MALNYGATYPPTRGFLRTNNSNTGRSDRYCIHNINCHWYKQSKRNKNTVDKECSSIEEMKDISKPYLGCQEEFKIVENVFCKF